MGGVKVVGDAEYKRLNVYHVASRKKDHYSFAATLYKKDDVWGGDKVHKLFFLGYPISNPRKPIDRDLNAAICRQIDAKKLNATVLKKGDQLWVDLSLKIHRDSPTHNFSGA